MKTLHHLSKHLGKGRQSSSCLKADVIFGSPAKKCAGIGICKVNPHNTPEITGRIPCCQSVSSEIRLLGLDQIEFAFSRRKICKKLIARQFAFSRFRINHSLALPAWLTDALGLASAHLVTGAYPVVFGEDSIRVQIRVRSI